MSGKTPRHNMRRANEWSRDQLAAMGCSNAHLEDWGEFGMGWQQLNSSVRMTSPDTAVFIAQAAPWSPATGGTISAPVVIVEVDKEEDIAKYKGQVAGKIVLVGKMRDVDPVDKPLFVRLDDKELDRIASYPTAKQPLISERAKDRLKQLEMRQKIGQFLAQEHARAMIVPSRTAEERRSGSLLFHLHQSCA